MFSAIGAGRPPDCCSWCLLGGAAIGGSPTALGFLSLQIDLLRCNPRIPPGFFAVADVAVHSRSHGHELANESGMVEGHVLRFPNIRIEIEELRGELRRGRRDELPASMSDCAQHRI